MHACRSTLEDPTLGLALATLGLYSTLSYGTALRTQEFGIRIALGAPKGDVIRIVFGSASAMVAAGVAGGLALSVASSRVLASRAIVSIDYRVMPVMVAILVAVAAVAALIPARRAADSDPIQALRA